MASKFLDDSGLSYLWLKIKTLVGGKVDKVDGKGLSTNDYTTTEKNKLSNIAAGAQVNVLEGIQKNGDTVTITNKIANISVPTKTSDLTNDSGYITSSDVPEGAAASTTTPKMDGTATVGTETAFARGDHIHPSDTTKVDKVTGKGLSTNDFTTALKNKLDGIAAGAEVNVNADWNANSGDAQILNKPTNVSDFTNDSGFITSADVPAASSTTPSMDGTAAVGTGTTWARADHVHPSDSSKANLASPTFTGTPAAPTAASGTNTTQIATTAFVKTAVDNAIAGVTQFSYEVVTTLPVTGVNGKIYLVAHSHGTGDAYDEYIWTGSGYEKIGNTDVDLSGYMLTTDMVAITNAEIDTACV